MSGSRLSDVVDEDDGEGIVALQSPEEGEELADIGSGVLICAVESDEGVEDEHLGPDVEEGSFEAALMVGLIEA